MKCCFCFLTFAYISEEFTATPPTCMMGRKVCLFLVEGRQFLKIKGDQDCGFLIFCYLRSWFLIHGLY